MQGLNADGEHARDRLMKFMVRLKRAADRTDAKRAAREHASVSAG